ncbi:hypothetical protein [Paludisphaera soli]|uniref:hypothetical protein n=1 Tax=Paludisphaera soli TaxID=2712865 RepID=UPI0013EB76CF|nr:hypothetical protein [Paludisphaera soli]
MSQIQAIVRKSFTVSITFTGTPSAELRNSLKGEGYEFKNGQWFKNQAESQIVSEADVSKAVAA